jgi:hypothetical protein
MSALPPKADIAERWLDVRFVPKGDIGNLIDHLDGLREAGYKVIEAANALAQAWHVMYAVVGRPMRNSSGDHLTRLPASASYLGWCARGASGPEGRTPGTNENVGGLFGEGHRIRNDGHPRKRPRAQGGAGKASHRLSQARGKESQGIRPQDAARPEHLALSLFIVVILVVSIRDARPPMLLCE